MGIRSTKQEENASESILDRYKKGVVSRRVMRKVRVKGRKGGGRKWDIWVVQLCCELLLVGVPPTAIPDTIVTMYTTLYGCQPDDWPGVNFVRQCRVVVEVIGETVVAVKLCCAKSWDQGHFDATSRGQKSFQALIISTMGDDMVLDELVVSSCIFLDNETARTTADGLIAKVREKIYELESCYSRMLISSHIYFRFSL